MLCDPGAHRILIRHDGYEDDLRTVTVRVGEVTPVSALLAELIGFLNIRTQPNGADVYLDDKKIGTTPLENRAVKIGEHEVSLKREGHRGIH